MVWDLESSENLTILAGHQSRVAGALLLPDGKRALSWSDHGTLRIWDLESGEALATLASQQWQMNGVLSLPDNRALSWSNNRSLCIWDLFFVRRLAYHSSDAEITCCIYAPKVDRFLLGDASGQVHILSLIEPQL